MPSHRLLYLCVSFWAALGSPSLDHYSLHDYQVLGGSEPSPLAVESKLPQVGDPHRGNVGSFLREKTDTGMSLGKGLT